VRLTRFRTVTDIRVKKGRCSVKARFLAITVAVLVFVPTALSATYAGGHVKKASEERRSSSMPAET